MYVDPGCPWTWRTAQWLRRAARLEGLRLEWRSFPLELLLDGAAVPAAFADGAVMSRSALRLIEALRAAERTDLVGDFYERLGTQVHERGVRPSRDLVTGVASSLGIDPAPGGDPFWDAAVADSFTEARRLTGGEGGSPVLAFGSPHRGVFGPVLTRTVSDAEATLLWRGVSALVEVGAFSELKRARTLDRPLAPDLAPHVSSSSPTEG